MVTSQRILVAVDESEASHRAAIYVADILGGGKPGLHVGLVHLELPPRMLEWGGSEDPGIEDAISSERAKDYQELEEAIEGGQSLLHRLQAILAERGIDVAALLVRFDEPLDRKHIANDVLKIAQERDYGTVVVGRHSFSGLKRLFGHHVGEELVRTGKGITIWVVE